MVSFSEVISHLPATQKDCQTDTSQKSNHISCHNFQVSEFSLPLFCVANHSDNMVGVLSCLCDHLHNVAVCEYLFRFRVLIFAKYHPAYAVPCLCVRWIFSPWKYQRVIIGIWFHAIQVSQNFTHYQIFINGSSGHKKACKVNCRLKGVV